jgi:hypothetical protein
MIKHILEKSERENADLPRVRVKLRYSPWRHPIRWIKDRKVVNVTEEMLQELHTRELLKSIERRQRR